MAATFIFARLRHVAGVLRFNPPKCYYDARRSIRLRCPGRTQVTQIRQNRLSRPRFSTNGVTPDRMNEAGVWDRSGNLHTWKP